ncbi:hypothetical protein HPB50_029512 [Hyalomma asiaticum]|nr:hypothetical protein HPB50_029512 [Hyalomma asiaticum]
MSERSESPSNSVLFVCLGNICRSPMAEAVFKHIAKERGVLDDWHVDSAGTGDWHVGCKPDKRAAECLRDHGVDMNHSARVTTEDFTSFKYIFGMDEDNISALHELAPDDSTAQIELLGKYDPQGKTIIRDPYYVSALSVKPEPWPCWRKIFARR